MSRIRTPEPEGFGEFWAEWRQIARHTDGRGLARDTYAKHLAAGAEPEDIVDGARWFARNLSERDRNGFVPLSATWLNREAYADFAQKERAFRDRQAERAANVVAMPQPSLPESHFSRQWQKHRKG